MASWVIQLILLLKLAVYPLVRKLEMHDVIAKCFSYVDMDVQTNSNDVFYSSDQTFFLFGLLDFGSMVLL